jgi:phosphoglucosamine mutase
MTAPQVATCRSPGAAPRFGTDGVRGIANEDLTASFALRLGIAAAHVLGRHATNRHVIVGRDSRVSGDMLEAALNAGLAATGCLVTNVGVVPTPAVSHIVARLNAAAGAVISASHNPYPDNGIKFLGPDGCKLSDALEAEIAEALGQADALPRPTGAGIGRIAEAAIGAQAGSLCYLGETRAPVLGYIAHVAATSGGPLDRFRLVIDCANGATSGYAPALFADLGATVNAICAEPDGANINEGCGSTSPDALCQEVARTGADAGLAFDGDGDRVMMCDEGTRLVDGDRIMAVCALGMHQRGELPHDAVVGTIMSNAGLEDLLARYGIALLRANVGDRYVAEEMTRSGAGLGGEQSGHVIFGKLTRTGDGMVTALQVLKEMRNADKPLSELAARMPVYPQVLRNVRVADRTAWQESAAVRKAMDEARMSLGKPEWLSVRVSGTEPLVRVMAQGPDGSLVERTVEGICALIQRHGGGS